MIEILENLKTITNEDVCSEMVSNGIEYHRAIINVLSDKSSVEGVILDTRPFLITNYPHLKVISRTGVGTDNVDLDIATELGVKVFTTPCQELTNAVAELTLWFMLSLLKRGAVRRRNLSAMTVGIIGLGKIGNKLAQFLYDMPTEVEWHDIKYGVSGAKEKVLKNSDIVTIHIFGDKQVIGEKELDMMKDGSYLINTARAECVDEIAVLGALKEGKLAGFASDVNNAGLFYYEIGLNKVIITPHIGSDTVEARIAIERLCVENLIKGLKEAGGK